ncbi:MAG: DUF3575 domain-containing protein [Bacteroidota bacterium]
MNKSSRFLLSIALLGLFHSSKAQEDIVKLGLLQLPFKNINLAYEHPFRRNISLHVSTNLQLPLTFDRGIGGNLVDNLNEDWETGEIRPGREWKGFDITPEVRFYTKGGDSRRSHAPTGFFFSVGVRYSQYNMLLPYHWTYENELEFTYEEETYLVTEGTVEADIDTDFQTKAVSGALGFGGQWFLDRNRSIAMGVDFAVGWGTAWVDGTLVNIVESVEFSDQDLQAALGTPGIKALIDQYAVDIVKEVEAELDNTDFPLASKVNIDLDSNGNVITARGTTPWMVLRLGFTVGYAF